MTALSPASDSLLPHDGGRSVSRRPNQKNDCTVIALAVATSSTYDDAYDILKASGRTSGQRFSFRQWAKKRRIFNGHAISPRTIPPTRKGMTAGDDLARLYSSGTYIARITGHVCVVRDGEVINLKSSQFRKPICDMWQVKPFRSN